MESISRFVFIPVMLCLLIAAFHEGTRKRLLSLRAVSAAESGLAALSRLYGVAFVLILASGVFVRCWQFGILPLGLNQDGTMAGIEASCLLTNGTDQYGISYPTYFKAWGFSQMSTLYSYLLMPFVKVLGLTRFSLRLPMLLVSVGSLIVIWDFARRVAGRGYALLALLVAATNPWHILQSRWALEANLMPHVLLMAVYLLYIGRKNRAALYASMVFFGLAPYAYGVACFSMPFIVLGAAVYYVWRRRVRWWDVALCVAVFLLVAGPYFVTMAINAFGWETIHLGPITLPRFADSMRARDISIMQEYPYMAMVWNLYAHLSTWLFDNNHLGECYNAIGWTHTMYQFMPIVCVCGAYVMWRRRRSLALQGRCGGERDGLTLVLLWMGAALANGILVGGVINRNNVVYYPLLLLAAYALYQMGRRLKVALAGALALILVSFIGLNATYFGDEAYRQEVGAYFHYGLQEALVDTFDWDYDRYYLTTSFSADREVMMASQVMFAHGVDYAARTEETDLTGPDGEKTGWYFGERYVFTDFVDFVPDPMECAVYILEKHETALFDPADFLLTDYGEYAVAYPRYWAQ